MMSDSVHVPASLLDAARDRLRTLGARVTQPRVQVLACLMRSEIPLTHQAVLEQMPADSGDSIDRVTVYRVLDWLVEQQVAQKSAGEDRVFRFSLSDHVEAQAQAHRQHGHFQCTRCNRTFCLDAPASPVAGMVPVPRVPAGFDVEHIELTIKGRCPQCH